MPRRPRILVVSENVTLAQVVRLITLGRALDPGRQELFFACNGFDERLFADTPFRRVPLDGLPRETIDAAIASGEPLYDRATLERYVTADRAVIADVRPDVIVGDFRLSLAISAPLSRVPLVTLINAYWSPYAARPDGFPLPEHPIVNKVGVGMAAKFFPLARPFVFRAFAKPVNDVRRAHRLRPLGGLLEVLTFGDRTIYADVPALVPLVAAPPTHRHIGAVPWSPPETSTPPWWDDLPGDRPIAYVTLGSSGDVTGLPRVLDGLAAAGVTPIVATAGRAALPDGVFGADLLPGAVAARRARFVVSNGGSSTGYQALAEGRPVLGVPYNLDQYLAMTAIQSAGAGVLVRSGTLTADAVRDAARRLLAEPAFEAAARRIAAELAAWDHREHFRDTIRELGC